MTEKIHPKLIYVLTDETSKAERTWIGQAGLKDGTSINLPPNSEELLRAAKQKAQIDLKGTTRPWKVVHAESAVFLSSGKAEYFTVTNIKKIVEMSGVMPSARNEALVGNNWFDCSPETAINAIRAAKEGRKTLFEYEKIPPKRSRFASRKTSEGKKRSRKPGRHTAADALDWEDAQMIIASLKQDARYRDAMLVAVGCYMGLRISDSLELRWRDIIDKEKVELTEQKTGKKRTIRLNPALKNVANECFNELYIDNPSEYIAKGTQNGGTTHITRQRVNQIIQNIKQTYLPGKNIVFSSHTFRKTFGRRVYENECKKGRGETALMLLADVFGHSNTNITKRYLGIRKEEILSVYDIL